MANSCPSFLLADVRFGSQAALQSHSSSTAACGAKPAVREDDFQTANLNDCFTQQRPFRTLGNHQTDSPLTAKSGHSREQKTDVMAGR